MKTSSPFKTLAVVGVGFVLASATSVFAQSQQGAARVAHIHGAARYSTGNNIWQPLREGAVIRPGTIIQTASGSQVDLILNNREVPAAGIETSGPTAISYKPSGEVQQNLVRMRENTLLSIDKLTWSNTGVDQVTDTQMDLRAGRIFGSVKKLSGASKYEIKIPNGVAGVRGTVYEISADGILSVFSGSVVVAYVSGDGVTTKVISAGEQFDPHTGIITPIPVANRDQAILDAQRAGTLIVTEETYYPEDRTILYVSPIIGTPSESQGFPE